ncbi:MAG: head-tail adaptor protein [Limnochordia bacterium]|jgi:head-tail adaptor
MRTGKLRHRIMIERYTETKDQWGDVTWAWTWLATTWAAVEPFKDGDYWHSLTLETVTTHKVTMRGIGEACRPRPGDRIIMLSKDNRILRVESVLDMEERGCELVLMCKEKTGEVWTPPEEPESNGKGE